MNFKKLLIILIMFTGYLFAGISVSPKNGENGDVFTIEYTNSSSLDIYDPVVKIYRNDSVIVISDKLIKQTSYHYAKAYIPPSVGEYKFKIGVLIDGERRFGDEYYFTVTEKETNKAPVVTSTLIELNSNGSIDATFNPYDEDNDTMGADIYLSYPNNANSFNPNTKKNVPQVNFTGTSRRYVSYTTNELKNFGIIKNVNFNYRVDLFDSKGNKGQGYSSTSTYTYEEPNQAPSVSNVSGSIDSNGNLIVSFNPYDPEGSTMGANIYLSNANDTENYNINSERTYSPSDFSGTSTRTITYSKSELTSLGINNRDTFKIRVNLFDNKGKEGVGKSSTITYTFEEPNQAPSVSNVSGSIDSNGNLIVSFNPYDPEGSTMGANIYLSNANDTGNYNINSERTYSPSDFSGTSTRTITYSKSELTSLGINNRDTFKIRVNLFDNKGKEGVGFSTVLTYSEINNILPTKVTSPVIGKFVIDYSTQTNQKDTWSFWQHKTGVHKKGKGICESDDIFAWDLNLNNPTLNDDKNKAVYSVADGIVTEKYGGCVNAGGSYGQLLIEHNNNGKKWWSGYLHMGNIQVKAGDKVYKNTTVVGYISDVGGNNDHLHLAVYDGENKEGKLKSFNVVFEERKEDTKVNTAPQHISTNPSLTNINNAQPFNIFSKWKDPDGDYIVNVKARYKDKNNGSYTNIVLSHISSDRDGENFIYTFENGLVAGEYEIEVQSSDKRLLQDLDVLHTTEWIKVSNIKIYDVGSDPTLTMLDNLPECKSSEHKDKGYACIKTGTKIDLTFTANDIDGDLKRLDVNVDGLTTREFKKDLRGSSATVNEEYTFSKDMFSLNCDKCTECEGEYKNQCLREFFILTASIYDSREKKYESPNVKTKFLLYNSDVNKNLLIIEENKKKEEAEAEKIKLEEEVNQINNEKINTESEITDYLLKYSDKVKETYNGCSLFILKKDDSCLWQNINGTCEEYSLPKIQKSFGFKVNDSIKNYPYTYHVQYAFNQFDTDDNYPARIWLESEYQGYEYNTKPLIAKNSTHLQCLTSILSEDFKTKIDLYNGFTVNIKNELVDKESYDNNIFIDPNIISEEIKSRLKNALDTSWNMYKNEIYNSAAKAQGSFSLIFDSDIGASNRLENGFRGTYQVSLGTLKALYGALGGLIYGSAEDEINNTLTSIKNYTEDEFHNLDEETQKLILKQIQKSVDLINTNGESRALAETALYSIGTKVSVVKGSVTASKAVLRQSIIVSKFTVQKFKQLFKTYKLPKTRIFTNLKNRILSLDLSRGMHIVLTGKLKQSLDDIVKNGDKLGKKTESLTKDFFTKNFTNYRWYNGSYNKINGFDGVMVKGTLANPIEIIILEAKQMHSGIQLRVSKSTGIKQMSDKWIKEVARKIENKELGDAILKLIDENPEAIRRVVTAVDKSGKPPYFSIFELFRF